MNILIAGSGFIGLPLALQLKNAGHIVSLTTTHKEKQERLLQEGLAAYLFDAGEPAGLLQISHRSFDHIIFTLPPSACKVNGYAHTLKTFLPLLVQGGTLSFTSSISVYENNNAMHTEASTALNRLSVVKDAEDAVMASGHHYYIFRLAGLIGGSRHPKNFLRGGIVENSSRPVNLVCGEDVVNSIALTIDRQLPYGIYNVCSPQHPTREAYYKHYLPHAVSKDGNIGKLIDSSRITALLSYRFQSIYI